MPKVYGQFNCLDSSKLEIYRNKVHNVVGFVPSNARVTNGWAIGWSTSVDDYCVYMDSIRINGLYTNISPFQVFVAGMAIGMGIFSLFNPETYKNISLKDTKTYDTLTGKHQLNGMAISLFELGEDFTMQGFQFTVLYDNMQKTNGVTVSLIASDIKQFNGVMISGIYNKAYKGKGLQIGLINTTKKMHGIQIGLWNKIGKRGLPFINMSFKKDK